MILAPLLAACGGSVSVLHAKGASQGHGAAVTVMNTSGTRVERLHVASTERVDRARASGVAPGSAEDDALWGNDLLDRAGLAENSTFPVELEPGRYDVLAVDHDGREELVKGLRLSAGRKYVLELGSDFRMAR